MAIADYKLMQKLGYGKYVAQGGDWGSIVVRIMGSLYPESCVAVHVNMLPSGVPSWWWNPLVFARFMMWAPFEGKKGMLGRLMWWMKDECGQCFPLFFCEGMEYVLLRCSFVLGSCQRMFGASN